ncbi:hypothetical protein LOD99_16013 [Oopsacas minuta]|uniref:tRNA-intron lyase n=1 Tax=Oopsacas minuta TaxID=111878 RepID=A0AAV7K7S6_9METZ|nr:hypothetical protein LOD99_16013 [Oopsacas minuta]
MAEKVAEKGAKLQLTRMPFGIVTFNKDTIMTLRTEYHITGSMAGCHPIMPHQSRHRGVPLLLMNEEVTLLRELEVVEFSGGWDYPENERDKLCYQIYKSLWKEGYYITEGSKFGGDYLAYPDDPIRVHSTHVVVVKEGCELFTPRDLIGGGRVANKTNKNLLYATLDENGIPNYISVEWSGLVGSEK